MAHHSVAYTTNGKVVIAYQDTDNSNRGTSIVGTVSGTSITSESAVVFKSSTVNLVSTVLTLLMIK